jgi:hypothetical protein
MNESVSEWISAYLYGHITPEQYEQLRTWLLADPAHVRQYIQEAYLHRSTRLVLLRRQAHLVHAGVEAELGHGPSCDPADLFRAIVESDLKQSGNGAGSKGLSPEEVRRLAELRLDAFLEEQRRLRRMEQGRAESVWDWEEVRYRVLLATGVMVRTCAKTAKIAAVALVVVLAVTVAVLDYRSHRIVATWTDSLQAKWDEPMPGPELRPGRLRLEQGFASITFKQGAQVILQAPTTIRLLSPNRMSLETGTITAKVSGEALGFSVNTPTAKVTDFGTEFGVWVDSQGKMESHVFDGKVQVRADKRDQMLMERQAGHVDGARHLQISSMEDRPSYFLRKIPDKTRTVGIPGKTLDLADVVGGGMGYGSGLLGFALDPATGETRSRYVAIQSPNRRKGDHRYHKVEGLPFVDGIFVPEGGQGPMVVTSENHRFVECPTTSNEYWVDVTNDEVEQEKGLGKARLILDGRSYCTVQRSGINMHPNLGITFNLEAVRQALPGTGITRFEAVCGISEQAPDYHPSKADFWVLVDGRPCFNAKGLEKGQYRPIRVELSMQDRFLTLVCTDGGNEITCDHAVFGEPILVLQSKTVPQ